MFNKQMLRKKAMDMVMKGGPSIAIKISKKPMMPKMGKMSKPVMDDSISQFANESEEMQRPKNENEAQGLVQMEVSPEEQEMIMAMRKEKGEGEGSEENEMEELNPKKMMA
jgi:hypothetical protein